MSTDPPIRSIRVTFTRPVSTARCADVLIAVWGALGAAGLQSSARLWRETTADAAVDNAIACTTQRR